MVFELRFRRRWRRPVLISFLFAGLTSSAWGADRAQEYLRESNTLFTNGMYFRSARYAFAAAQESKAYQGEGYSRASIALVRAGLPHAASYFFIRALQVGGSEHRRRALTGAAELLTRVGPDILRPYLVRHTKIEDYDASNRNAFLYSIAKTFLLKGNAAAAIDSVAGMNSKSSFWPYALQLRATAYALKKNAVAALNDFEACADLADDGPSGTSDLALDEAVSGVWVENENKKLEDLTNRCRAGVARVLYERGEFEKAERAYDRIPKSSFVWTDILFEQAWNAFAEGKYNQALGKLVTYKSPALKFVHNTEVDVLRAQTYLVLCLYNDANHAINEFNESYGKLGRQIKDFLESNQSDLDAFHRRGRKSVESRLHTDNPFDRVLNRFTRSPYFMSLVAAEREIDAERAAVQRFSQMQSEVSQGSSGFPGFLRQVLGWRDQSIKLLGGAFVKNSLLDHYSILIGDFDKIAFIKLEMLGRAKDVLLDRESTNAYRGRGNVEPNRRDNQFYWSFNGEFWNDEIGDYVFGLESACKS